jgi:uncharacterized membrane protein
MQNQNDRWKFGLFYFDASDKRLFVPKRLEMAGMTLNFGNPNSIIIAFLLFGLILFAIYS